MTIACAAEAAPVYRASSDPAVMVEALAEDGGIAAVVRRLLRDVAGFWAGGVP